MMSEQLNETLLELKQTKERESRLAEENQVIFATLSALSQSQNKYQIFDELNKVLSRYIQFDDFVVISKEKSEVNFSTFLSSGAEFEHCYWGYRNKFHRALNGECILVFEPEQVEEFQSLPEPIKATIHSALIIGIRAQASDSVLLLFGREKGQFDIETKATLSRFRPLIERAIGDIEHKEELQTLVSLRTQELQEARQAAEKANETKSQFLAMMSHELRTPLNAVIGIIELLRRDSDEHQNKLLTRMENSADLLHAIIGDILDISVIESGHSRLNKQWINLHDRLANAFEYHEKSASQKGLAFELEIQVCRAYEYFIDPARLIQIVFNLAGNSIKFTDKGKVSVHIRSEKQLLKIQVADTGIGMDSGSLNQLFEPFMQVDNTRTRNYGGTGLGLAITKHLVELMDGYIQVSSQLKKGTVFTITLPLQMQRIIKEQANEQDIRTLPVKSSGNILVVEDTRTNQVVIQLLLTQMGYNVTIVDNGQLSLEIVDTEEQFDLILMDISMPVMDGIEATQKLRAKGIGTPIIALTAHSTPEDKQRCLDAGMNDWIVKPFRSHHIDEVVMSYLNQD
ncbi:Autoinducer 2 sensor kinase/phosphatase LuxQ [Vibrio aerogenes CECT 7868]|uniref:histidine kinase n=1 Tax=Vibrio aerogenes CECT 7868 TaxID=1216006 RepID=A0A1M5Z6N8_9VIBR|nr:ATP-binding protein [Vibrio aerogenes]SHI19927.1 Autoinducer 2 sensor kinase/phosphatase LuxQ [Vibrio aerogenes CECT 7868]